MDKFRALKFFCRVVEMRSFASAAHALDVPPSAVSRVISALEADLKCTLFNRTTRKLSLTDGGAAYYERCRQCYATRDISETSEIPAAGRDDLQRSGRSGAEQQPADAEKKSRTDAA